MHRTSPGGESGKLSDAILRSIATVAAAIFVAACSSMTARSGADYDRGSTSEAQFVKDAATCDKEAEAHQKEFGYGPYDPTRGPYNRLYDACMRSHGYQRKPQP